ncbi:MAG: phosphatidylserine decarboxylase family protein [Crocinitomicaceae bacterium]|nr:phosphatidylserine decarboxylase family protein [Crocinitomicaceae bacterium]
MKIHKQGYGIITIALLLLGGLSTVFILFIPWIWLWGILVLAAAIFFFLIVYFFRVPKRAINIQTDGILSPADGKVVVIEEVEETEYFNDKRIQISVFMSPLNVHANYNPIGGKVQYFKYHPGKFLVAWHPKSSTENERTTTVIRDEMGREILFRQVAGAVARRIRWFQKVDDQISQGSEMGFIRFGSRLDIFVPVDSKIQVELEQVVKAKQTILAKY